MKTVFQFIERIAPFFLRFSLALILLWNGISTELLAGKH
jgi:hypothetical protein